jgi:hypothetical protein
MEMGVCVKSDAWNAQRVVNERYDRMFERIEHHLGEQTIIMRDIARQGEQIISLRRDQEEDRRLIEKLFSRDRDHDERIAGKADTVPWFKSIPVFAAVASLVLAALAWSRG